MKKKLLLGALLLLNIALLNAQVPRFVLFEHFTQASCGPCADQNPAFQDAILDGSSTAKVHHIAYHTSWPGTDPMYNHNAIQNDARTIYYNVTGVPDVFMNGNQKNAQPGGFSVGDVEQQFAMGSPIKVSTNLVNNGAESTVTVTVSSFGEAPTGTYALSVAVIERNVNYTNPPGSNGETYFPNVFRLMVPDDSETITLPAVGSSATYTYTFANSSVWNMDEIHAVAFVQNTNTREILNSGADFDAPINYTLNVNGTSAVPGVAGETLNFEAASTNTGTAEETFIYTLASNAPADWAATLSINGTTATNPASVNTAAGATSAVSVAVVPGTTPGLITYTLSVTSSANPDAPALIQTFYVISGVTDLIVNNSAGRGDGTGGSAADWGSYFSDGLTAAGCTSFAVTDEKVAEQAIKDGALGQTDYLYLNFGWTFPALTVSLSEALTQYANSGGNIFVCGQDVAWAAFDGNGGQNPYVSAEAQDFLSDIMGIGYSNDGATADNKLNPLAAEIAASLGQININAYYGSTYFFPDNLIVQGSGIKVASYVSASKTAAVRTDVAQRRTMYIAPGLEMLGTDVQKNQVMTLAYNYLHGLITGIEIDAAFQSLLGQNFPNPADAYAIIPIGELTHASTLRISDVAGRLVQNTTIAVGTASYRLDTEQLPAGTYFYQLSNADGISPMKTLVVAH